jgi:hypothetical protein
LRFKVSKFGHNSGRDSKKSADRISIPLLKISC